ncbi:MAG: oxygen-independent coproporphyrinogen III oxidase [Acetobacteraceae bacterium]|nr:oxygen-independent coproporphyrinogen III oxidase [Acetobacteraceae bacterium]
MTVASLIAKYDQRVPRYTSYPTAPHFSAGVTPDVHAAWLGSLPDDGALSLYLHVPFCASLCLFCACHTTVVHRLEPLVAYGKTLEAEIALVADAIGRTLPVRHIHWGGGTPTILPPAVMHAIMQRLRTRFAVQPDAEIAVEIDPRTLSDEGIDGLARMGTTRASLGVQDFEPSVQQAINRDQSLELTASCTAKLRAAGIGSINLDLIYGLPRQTTPGVIDTVTQALSLAPDRAAVFGYAHVPWMKKHQALIPEASLPGPQERFAQRQAVEDTLTGDGYQAIGLDHFARPGDSLAIAAAEGRLRRNFQGYTTDDAPTLLGLGASSIGALPGGYVQNHAGVPAWRNAVRAGSLPTARGFALSDADRLRRHVIEQVMCHMAVDLRVAAARFGADPASLMDAAPALQTMQRDGLLTWNGYALHMTPKGRPFVRAAAAAFDSYLQAGAARHSAAI